MSISRADRRRRRARYQLFIRRLLKFNSINAKYLPLQCGGRQHQTFLGNETFEFETIRNSAMESREGAGDGEIAACVKLEIVARHCRRKLARIQRIRRAMTKIPSQLYVNLLPTRFSFSEDSHLRLHRLFRNFCRRDTFSTRRFFASRVRMRLEICFCHI